MNEPITPRQHTPTGFDAATKRYGCTCGQSYRSPAGVAAHRRDGSRAYDEHEAWRAQRTNEARR